VLRAREGAVAELALSKVGAGGTAMNTLETRVVDRSFIDNGARWIIDYKTADLGAHASEADFTAHAGRFRAQLQAYAILFADESLPQRLAIFYVAHGKLITITN
jgi:ATP-dependent exoDNAse (exonuclease V) beta subunit